jgi:hypothetical protein
MAGDFHARTLGAALDIVGCGRQRDGQIQAQNGTIMTEALFERQGGVCSRQARVFRGRVAAYAPTSSRRRPESATLASRRASVLNGRLG